MADRKTATKPRWFALFLGAIALALTATAQLSLTRSSQATATDQTMLEAAAAFWRAPASGARDAVGRRAYFESLANEASVRPTDYSVEEVSCLRQSASAAANDLRRWQGLSVAWLATYILLIVGLIRFAGWAWGLAPVALIALQVLNASNNPDREIRPDDLAQICARHAER